MNRVLHEGDIVSHFKGNYYRIEGIARHSETEELMVVYRQLYAPYQLWVRPLEMFNSYVDHKKYPEVTQQYRFEIVETH